MNIKETVSQFFQNQKKNIYIWLAVVTFADIMAAIPHISRFLQSGQCKNYMQIGSSLQSCTFFEFVKNGWAWITFTNIFMFIPTIVFLLLAIKLVDAVLVKKDE